MVDKIESAGESPWQPIATAPKDHTHRVNYIIITDGICLPDLVIWHDRKPERTDTFGTRYCAVPEGWFCTHGGRSRILNPTHWMPVPEQPAT